MKKLVLLIFCLFICSINCLANNSNMIDKTNFVNGGYFDYDLKSFKQNNSKNIYYIDVMEELDPGGDMENIKCPYGVGRITHLIYSTRYSPKSKKFNAKYKGFVCSLDVIEYDNGIPSYSYFNKKGIYYDNNTYIFGKYKKIIDSDSLDFVLKNIKNNENNDYIEFMKKIIEKNQL